MLRRGCIAAYTRIYSRLFPKATRRKLSWLLCLLSKHNQCTVKHTHSSIYLHRQITICPAAVCGLRSNPVINNQKIFLHYIRYQSLSTSFNIFLLKLFCDVCKKKIFCMQTYFRKKHTNTARKTQWSFLTGLCHPLPVSLFRLASCDSLTKWSAYYLCLRGQLAGTAGLSQVWEEAWIAAEIGKNLFTLVVVCDFL